MSLLSCVMAARPAKFLQGADSCGTGDGSEDPSKKRLVFHLCGGLQHCGDVTRYY